MPYLYSDEQNQIREEVRRTLSGTADPATLRRLLETSGQYDEGYWQTARDMGWTAMNVAEADGGLGLSLVETMIVAEETGRVLAGAPFLATGFAAAHALKLGDEPELLGALAGGQKIVALAFSEGNEPLPLDPAVTIGPDGRVAGEKTAVLGGAVADMALILCRDAGGVPAIALIDLNSAGVTRAAIPSIDNSRCLAALSFDGATATVLPLNDAALVARQCLARLALHLASEAVGGIEACLKMAADYANQRQAFGQAIGKFQAVKHAISEIYVANELARASVLDAAVRLENGDDDAEAYVAAARLNANHGYDYAAAATTQVHGGIGVTWEAEPHLHYRRARSLALEAGGATYWEDRIASYLEAA
jgi:alkylation response protein AidB-like acyl-CoA dehydrogenase